MRIVKHYLCFVAASAMTACAFRRALDGSYGLAAFDAAVAVMWLGYAVDYARRPPAPPSGDPA